MTRTQTETREDDSGSSEDAEKWGWQTRAAVKMLADEKRRQICGRTGIEVREIQGRWRRQQWRFWTTIEEMFDYRDVFLGKITMA